MTRTIQTKAYSHVTFTHSSTKAVARLTITVPGYELETSFTAGGYGYDRVAANLVSAMRHLRIPTTWEYADGIHYRTDKMEQSINTWLHKHENDLPMLTPAPVVFYVDKERLPNGNVSVFAVFPEQSANYGRVASYAHLGQSSEASIEYVLECRKATEAEAASLKQELESMGMYLRVMQRLSMNVLREQAWA